MRTLPRLFSAGLLLALLASCSPIIDAGQARICRAIILAFNPLDATIEIVRTTPLAAAGGLRIDYRVRSSLGHRDRFVECRFATGNTPALGSGTLQSVITDEGILGNLRLHFLKRFWLGGEATSADPEPVRNVARAPVLPRTLAIGLQHLIFALPSIAIYSLLAVAYSLVYGLVGRINLAFGELAAVGGYAAFLGFALAGSPLRPIVPLSFALLLALVAAAAHGVATGRMLFAPLMRSAGQHVLIGTIALAIVLQEYLRLAQGSKLVWLQPLFSMPYAVARAGDFVVTLTPVAITAAALCLLAGAALIGLLKVSRFGRAWRACSDDPAAAALFGIDHRVVLLRTFALASLLAGLAGYVVTIYYGAFGYAGGIMLGLKSLFAAIAGGIGSVPGAFLGGILLGCAESLWSALFPIEFRDLAIFIFLVVLLIVRPSGLFGWGDTPKPSTSGRTTP